jgi:hypothetical protein
MVAAGLVVRVVLAFATRGAAFDIDSFEIVRRGLEHDPLHVYAEVNHGFYRWPYPPAYFPWIALAGWLSDATGLRFDGWFQLPAILADAGIAWLVWQLLALRGASERVRLLGAGLVMFGPTFLLISGYHGQIDATAILPALAAVYVWERGGARRGLWAGLLVGVGGAVKIVPLAMLLPLVVAARGRREAGWLVGGASLVMAVVLLPWLAADFGGTIDSLKNRGFPGLGGISLILNPDLTDAALRGTVPDNTALVEWLNRNGWIVPAVLLFGVAVLLWKRRPPVMESALIVWLVLTVFGVNFALQYAVWVLPFLIASGRLRSALLLQALLLPPALVFYMAPWQSSGAVVVYYVCMTAVWVLMVGLLATTVREAVRGKREQAAA